MGAKIGEVGVGRPRVARGRGGHLQVPHGHPRAIVGNLEKRKCEKFTTQKSRSCRNPAHVTPRDPHGHQPKKNDTNTKTGNLREDTIFRSS